MNTILIITIVSGIVFLMVILFVIVKKQRKEQILQFLEVNKTRAIVKLYSNNAKINDIDISRLNSINGEQGQKIVALETCTHTFEGRFFASDTKDNVNYRSKKVKFSLDLENGHTYKLGLYFLPPDQITGKTIFIFPLGEECDSACSQMHIICYEED